MRWYKISSMDITIGDYRQPRVGRDMLELSSHVQTELFRILEKSMTPQQIELWRKSQPAELFTIDGETDYAGEEGILNFYCPGIPSNLRQKMVEAIKYYGKEFGGEITGPIAQETFQQTVENMQANGQKLNADWYNRIKPVINDIRVMRFQAKLVPNERTNQFAPEINLSNMNAALMFRDVLNYPSTIFSDGFASFNANELLMKAGIAKNEFNIKARTEETNQERAQMENHGEKPGPQVYVQPLNEGYILDMLSRIESLCRWAVQNGYSTINVG